MAIDWRGDALAQKIHAAAMVGVVASGEMVREEADSLQNETPRTGRSYLRRGVVHVASSPGNAPAPDTGRLRQSLRTEYNHAELSGVVIASTEYAMHLEMGTEKMAPRPFMRPALANRKQDVEDRIRQEIRDALKG